MDRPDHPATSHPARRRLAAGAFLVLLLALGGAGGLWALVRAGDPAPRPSPAPPPAPLATPSAAAAPVRLEILSATGTVEQGTAGQDWRPVAAGDVLEADHQLRTGPASSAELGAGTASRLTIGERTQLGVRELTAAVHRFRLARGRVAVDYRPDGDRVVRIEAEDGGAVAEAREAGFHVAANGLTFAVASRTGTVALTSSGATVAVAAGEEALAEAGRPPAPPHPIPTELLLKVAEASRLGPAGRCLDTTGRSDPGALVTVDGEPVPVGADGRFPVRVARRGRGGVSIVVTSPDGRVVARTLPCRVEPEARIKELKVRWKRAEP